ncbi:hypothetical protein BL243_25315 [Ralstonia solanacearum]|nr:hypothetical protein BL243_25315 [Ralstonia solanacearum]
MWVATDFTVKPILLISEQSIRCLAHGLRFELLTKRLRVCGIPSFKLRWVGIGPKCEVLDLDKLSKEGAGRVFPLVSQKQCNPAYKFGPEP